MEFGRLRHGFTNLYCLNQRIVLFYMNVIFLKGVKTNETAGGERNVCPGGQTNYKRAYK